MNWKEFLKLDWRKIVIVIILGLISYFYGLNYCYTPPCPEGMGCAQVCGIRVEPLLWGPGFIFFGYDISRQALSVILGLVYWYFLSCIIIWGYNKIKKKYESSRIATCVTSSNPSIISRFYVRKIFNLKSLLS